MGRRCCLAVAMTSSTHLASAQTPVFRVSVTFTRRCDACSACRGDFCQLDSVPTRPSLLACPPARLSAAHCSHACRAVLGWRWVFLLLASALLQLSIDLSLSPRPRPRPRLCCRLRRPLCAPLRLTNPSPPQKYHWPSSPSTAANSVNNHHHHHHNHHNHHNHDDTTPSRRSLHVSIARLAPQCSLSSLVCGG